MDLNYKFSSFLLSAMRCYLLLFWFVLLFNIEQTYAGAKKVRIDHPLGCDIKGNINSKKIRIYHLPGSRSYNPTKINKKNERWFCTEKQAQDAGWRAAGRFAKRPVREPADCKLPKGRKAGDPLIKGNITKLGKLYHLPCSGLYAETIIDEKAGEKWFRTEDEAHKAGWFKSGKIWIGNNQHDFSDCIVPDNAPVGKTVKGNISKNGRIYHVLGSRHYAETSIRPQKGERWFTTEGEAKAAGWRAPKNNNPRPDDYCQTYALVGLKLRGSILSGKNR